VMLEYAASSERKEDHVLRRLRVTSSGSGSGLDEGLLVGDRTLVQDVLVHGDFESCVTFGPRMYASQKTPAATGRVVNLTCRLTGSESHAPRAAFEVASVKDTLLANVAVDLSVAAPLFKAQRRSAGDTGVTALDVPASFTLQAAAIRGVSTTFDGFTAASGSYKLVSVDTVLVGDPFFVSATDSHLAGGAKAIDTGVDPATLDSSLKAGVSIDGVSRQGRKIDRGAFEQGS